MVCVKSVSVKNVTIIEPRWGGTVADEEGPMSAAAEGVRQGQKAHTAITAIVYSQSTSLCRESKNLYNTGTSVS